MIWALIEVVLPMLLTFLFGLLLGWFLWRRYRHSDSEWWSDAADSDSSHEFARRESTSPDPDFPDTVLPHENNSDQQKSASAVLAAGQASSGELSLTEHSRFIHEQALAKELTAANASIRSLVAELDVTRTRLQSCESRLHASELEVVGADGSASESKLVAVRDNAENLAVDCSNCAATREQLNQLQTAYQALETSQSIDKAVLAKKHHLESRLSNLTRELNDSKVELSDARKVAGQLQAEVDQLSAEVSAGHTETESHASLSNTDQPDVAQLKSQLAQMKPAAQQAKEYQSQVAVLQARLQQSEAKVRQIEQSGQRIDQLDSQLQTRLADELEKSQQQVHDLEHKASQTTGKAAELVRMRSRVATLESELGDANSRAEDAEKLQQRVTELESMLKGSEIKLANERLVEAEAQLRIANNRVADQERQINQLHSEVSSVEDANTPAAVEDISEQCAQPGSAPVRRQRGAESSTGSAADSDTAISRNNENSTDSSAGGAGSSTGRSTGIAAYIDDSHQQIDEGASDSTVQSTDELAGEKVDQQIGNEAATQYTAQPATQAVTQAAAPPAAQPATRPATRVVPTRNTGTTEASKVVADPPQWQAGVTRFGTPAARHKDDLKVIRGIGPVLERTLNEAEIQTWDQLAALTADDIELIEKSIDFPGRMTRERWVEQASELVELYPDTEGRPSGKKLLPKKG